MFFFYMVWVCIYCRRIPHIIKVKSRMPGTVPYMSLKCFSSLLLGGTPGSHATTVERSGSDSDQSLFTSPVPESISPGWQRAPLQWAVNRVNESSSQLFRGFLSAERKHHIELKYQVKKFSSIWDGPNSLIELRHNLSQRPPDFLRL